MKAGSDILSRLGIGHGKIADGERPTKAEPTADVSGPWRNQPESHGTNPAESDGVGRLPSPASDIGNTRRAKDATFAEVMAHGIATVTASAAAEEKSRARSELQAEPVDGRRMADDGGGTEADLLQADASEQENPYADLTMDIAPVTAPAATMGRILPMERVPLWTHAPAVEKTEPVFGSGRLPVDPTSMKHAAINTTMVEASHTTRWATAATRPDVMPDAGPHHVAPASDEEAPAPQGSTGAIKAGDSTARTGRGDHIATEAHRDAGRQATTRVFGPTNERELAGELGIASTGLEQTPVAYDEPLELAPSSESAAPGEQRTPLEQPLAFDLARSGEPSPSSARVAPNDHEALHKEALPIEQTSIARAMPSDHGTPTQQAGSRQPRLPREPASPVARAMPSDRETSTERARFRPQALPREKQESPIVQAMPSHHETPTEQAGLRPPALPREQASPIVQGMPSHHGTPTERAGSRQPALPREQQASPIVQAMPSHHGTPTERAGLRQPALPREPASPIVQATPSHREMLLEQDRSPPHALSHEPATPVARPMPSDGGTPTAQAKARERGSSRDQASRIAAAMPDDHGTPTEQAGSGQDPQPREQASPFAQAMPDGHRTPMKQAVAREQAPKIGQAMPSDRARPTEQAGSPQQVLQSEGAMPPQDGWLLGHAAPPAADGESKEFIRERKSDPPSRLRERVSERASAASQVGASSATTNEDATSMGSAAAVEQKATGMHPSRFEHANPIAGRAAVAPGLGPVHQAPLHQAVLADKEVQSPLHQPSGRQGQLQGKTTDKPLGHDTPPEPRRTLTANGGFSPAPLDRQTDVAATTWSNPGSISSSATLSSAEQTKQASAPVRHFRTSEGTAARPHAAKAKPEAGTDSAQAPSRRASPAVAFPPSVTATVRRSPIKIGGAAVRQPSSAAEAIVSVSSRDTGAVPSPSPLVPAFPSHVVPPSSVDRAVVRKTAPSPEGAPTSDRPAHPTRAVSPASSPDRTPPTPELTVHSAPPLHPELRRVRAAVLELQHRLSGPGNAANAPSSSSRNSFVTPTQSDKRKDAESVRSPLATRASRLAPPRVTVADSATVSGGGSSMQRDTGAKDDHRSRRASPAQQEFQVPPTSGHAPSIAGATASPPPPVLSATVNSPSTRAPHPVAHANRRANTSAPPTSPVLMPAPAPAPTPDRPAAMTPVSPSGRRSSSSGTAPASSVIATPAVVQGARGLSQPEFTTVAPPSNTTLTSRTAVAADIAAAPSSRPGAAQSSSSSTSSALSEHKRNSQTSSPAISPEAPRLSTTPLARSAADVQAIGATTLPSSLSPATLDGRALGTPAAQPAPREAMALLDLAADDPTLRASAIGRNTHVRLETENDGDLSLHMLVRDGVVDVRFDGAAARTLDLRSNELRVALAGEGIALGTFEASSSANPAGTSTSSSADPGSNGGAGASQSGNPNNQTAGPFGSSSSPSSSSHSGSNFGGGRHSEASDRWPDREPSAPSGPGRGGPTSTAKPTAEPRRRRGFHVTA